VDHRKGMAGCAESEEHAAQLEQHELSKERSRDERQDGKRMETQHGMGRVAAVNVIHEWDWAVADEHPVAVEPDEEGQHLVAVADEG